MEIEFPIVPREFQTEGYKKLIATNDDYLIVAAPGAGKTILMLMLAKYYLSQDKRVLITVHMLEVLNQMITQAKKWNLNFGVIQSCHPLRNYKAPLQLASSSTLVRREINKYDVMIIDEVHIITKSIYNMMKDETTRILGLSATPYKKGLKEIFGNNILNLATAKELTDLGHLTKLRIYSGRRMDIKSLTIDKLGEYSNESIKKATIEILGDIIKTWKELADNKQTLVFCSSISHAKLMCGEFNRNGIPSGVYCANTTNADKKDFIEGFRNGAIKVLFSVFAIATGFDVPDATVMIDARPLESLLQRLYSQLGV